MRGPSRAGSRALPPKDIAVSPAPNTMSDVAEDHRGFLKECPLGCWSCGGDATAEYVWPGGDRVSFVCKNCPDPTKKTIPWRSSSGTASEVRKPGGEPS